MVDRPRGHDRLKGTYTSAGSSHGGYVSSRSKADGDPRYADAGPPPGASPADAASTPEALRSLPHGETWAEARLAQGPRRDHVVDRLEKTPTETR